MTNKALSKIKQDSPKQYQEITNVIELINSAKPIDKMTEGLTLINKEREINIMAKNQITKNKTEIEEENKELQSALELACTQIAFGGKGFYSCTECLCHHYLEMAKAHKELFTKQGNPVRYKEITKMILSNKVRENIKE
jgi:hypothetical protein